MRRIALAGFVLVLAACGGGDRGEEATPTTATTTAATTEATTPERGAQPIGPEGALPFAERDVVANGLEVPWGLAFVDEETLLVAERPGRVRVVEHEGGLRDAPAGEIDVESSGEGGLLGLALHPNFAEERFVYAYSTASDGNRVSRFAVGDDLTLSDEEVILDGIPSAAFHDGGALAFGPDELLYVGTGDAGRPEAAADRDSLAGKILRLEADGSVPDENPFPGSPVYSWGHRNVQGFAWDLDGRLYATEHGPSGEFGLCCHDEVNRIEPGAFYGWPMRAGRVEAAGGRTPAEAVEPLAESGEDTWAPSGIAHFDGDLYVAALRGQQLLRLHIGNEGLDEPAETVVDDVGRIRAVATGPDDCLYWATSNRDGRGDPADADDRLFRVCGEGPHH